MHSHTHARRALQDQLLESKSALKSGRPVGCMSTLLKQHLNTHKQQLRTLGLQIIIHNEFILRNMQALQQSTFLTRKGSEQL